MKRSLPLILPFLSIILLLNSCATGKNSVTDFKPDSPNVKENNSICFVQKNDGSIQNYTSLKLVNAVFNDAYLLADSKTRIYPKEIKAYQDNYQYAISQNSFTNGRKSYVAIDALPGFAVQIAKGKLNVYCKKFYNGAHAVDEFYLQTGDNGPIKVYSKQLMNEILKDNAEAFTFFNNNIKDASLLKKLQALAAVINNDHLISKN